jgi:hypothetical protein
MKERSIASGVADRAHLGAVRHGSIRIQRIAPFGFGAASFVSLEPVARVALR